MSKRICRIKQGSVVDPSCRLCHKVRDLRKSHIIPEFLYRPLYNSKGHVMGINGRCNRGWKPVQKGEREPLFCESCEQYFNEYFEKPFHAQWVAAKLLPNLWHNDDVYWATVDYSSFKLFHLSVLFRASVTSLPTFAKVSLGPHEEKLRQLTLKRDAAEPHQYPVHGVVVVHPETHGIVPVVWSRPARSSYDGHRCYGTLYGGVQWWVCVPSHRNVEFERVALQPDGRMPFHARPMNEFTSLAESIQNATQCTSLTLQLCVQADLRERYSIPKFRVCLARIWAWHIIDAGRWSCNNRKPISVRI